MQTIHDETAARYPVLAHVNTSEGRFNFYTDSSSKYEIIPRLLEQVPAITWADMHHAHVEIL